MGADGGVGEREAFNRCLSFSEPHDRFAMPALAFRRDDDAVKSRMFQKDDLSTG